MKLRSQISLVLLLLGLTPLLVALTINWPLVFHKLEQFYHKAYLEQLRTDFRDLDQHITRRQEMVRLFAKFPEPGIASNGSDAPDPEQLQQARKSYIEWVNRVLFDQLDITQIIFISNDGQVTLALNRNQQTAVLEPNKQNVDLPDIDFLSAGLKVAPGNILTSPISLDDTVDPDTPNRFMTLSFISPLVTASIDNTSPELRGVVIFNLDIGGLAHFYNSIYWVQNNGHYLIDSAQSTLSSSTAFQDFPGLEELFAKGKIALWEQAGQQIFWLPMFTVEGAGPLWVGRNVDASPITEFSRQVQTRIIIVISILLVAVYLVARIIAVRTERVSHELGQKMSRVLEADEAVNFSWQKPEELRELGTTLTRLSEKHARDTQALREHAHELENSNRYKSEFLANVSHELRTPLNSILLLSKMLASEDTQLSNDQRQQAAVINNAGRDLRNLIDTILDLSRIEAGKSTLNCNNIVLPELLRDLLELMRPQFEEKGLHLDLHIEPEAMDTITSDAEKIRQILINFLSNALKFTERGQCSLILSNNSRPGQERLPIAISVRDSGIGIAADTQASVFDAFNQVDGSTSRRYGGTGLGLTISRELATLLGGHIRVSSVPGKGSTFTLLLPQSIDETDTTSSHTTTATTSRSSNRPVGNDQIIPTADYTDCRILVVDNDIRNLLALTPVLEKWGVSVIGAGDGQEALDTLQGDSAFDLILMDLMMPEQDGFKTMERIATNPLLAAIPVIALTAKISDEDRQRALACGAVEFLTKPVEADKLKLVLDQCLHHKIRKDVL